MLSGQGLAVRRALCAAVAVPSAFAIGSEVVGDGQVATFAAFGSFALLNFVVFPGTRRSRLAAYLLLAVAGCALIALGSLTADPDWLAVLATVVVAAAVLFSGVVSSVTNAATQASLLTFLLAVLLPGGWSALPSRLGGWAIALAICVPVGLFVLAPPELNVLRRRTAALCDSIATVLRPEQPVLPAPFPLDAMARDQGALQLAFRASSAARSSALSTSARLLGRLVDELEWLSRTAANSCADAVGGWPQAGLRLRTAAAEVLESCGGLLQPAAVAAGPSSADLDPRLAELDEARQQVSAAALADLVASTSQDAGGAARGELDRPLFAAHELGYAVAVVAGTVRGIAAADARGWWARLLGRRVRTDDDGVLSGVQRATVGQLDRHSVWLQNSVRGGVGLGLAVLLARVVDAQNAFWIGLGALSVLRTNALATRASVLRALLGTAAGFAVGGVLVQLIGSDVALLWILLPVTVLVAASAPVVVSFVVGQAAFTVFAMILFNIIAPSGWRIGVVRIEDVALGCAASLVAGLLLWPRGAAAALGAAFGEAYRTSSAYLSESVRHLIGLTPGAPLPNAAQDAGSRLDDALRQYWAEQGTKRVSPMDIADLTHGAVRLRLAGTAIARLSDGGLRLDGLDEPVAVLDRRCSQVTTWYGALATGLVEVGPALPEPDDVPAAESFLDTVLPALRGCGDDGRAVSAEVLLWCGQYLGDVDQLRTDLVDPASQLAAARARVWWR